MDTVADIHRIVDMMRGLGHVVEFVPGWEDRGTYAFTRMKTRLDHHDAWPPGTVSSALRMSTFGRSDLRNSLCMWYLPDATTTPDLYVVAARQSWHAGRGILTTNSESSGSEARNDGRGERWPARQLQANLDLDACCVIVWGVTVYDHKEHAPDRKVDRVMTDTDWGPITPGDWRRRVAQRVAEIRSGKPTPPKETFLMALNSEQQSTLYNAVIGDVRPALTRIEAALRDLPAKASVLRDPRDGKAWVITDNGRWWVPSREVLNVLIFIGQVAAPNGDIPVADPSWIDGIPKVATPDAIAALV